MPSSVYVCPTPRKSTFQKFKSSQNFDAKRIPMNTIGFQFINRISTAPCVMSLSIYISIMRIHSIANCKSTMIRLINLAISSAVHSSSWCSIFWMSYMKVGKVLLKPRAACTIHLSCLYILSSKRVAPWEGIWIFSSENRICLWIIFC